MVILSLPLPLSLSLVPSLPPTSVAFDNSNSGPSAFPSATSSANPLFSVQPCQLKFFTLELFMSFLLCLLHLRHFVHIRVIDRLFCLPAPPAFGGFYYPYFGQKLTNCAVPNFKLKITRCIFLWCAAKQLIHARLQPWDMESSSASLPFTSFLSRATLQVLKNVIRPSFSGYA